MKPRNFLHLLFNEQEMADFEKIWDDELIRFNVWSEFDPFDCFNPKYDLTEKLKEIMPTKVEIWDDSQLEFLASELYHEFF